MEHAAPTACRNGCGRPAAGGYPTCCRTCTSPGGGHGPLCNSLHAPLCENGCGRNVAGEYRTCCRTCRGPGSSHGPTCDAQNRHLHPAVCANHCGRPAARGYPTCCRTCSGPGSRHGPACDASHRRDDDDGDDDSLDSSDVIEDSQDDYSEEDDDEDGDGVAGATEWLIDRNTVTTTLSEHEARILSAGGSGCAICLDDFQAGQEARRLPCLDTFHKKCADEALRISRKCPLCQNPISTHTS
eukprot:TRINITY_DN23923_c0_g2_i1.p1 TRINITY_DN23923_c0_g2~~TRINITY_DN23923_c0_g2_i1.p1  ORF type:complete len:242 (-),score=10.30 TRINITY_DN23923_c0_g2_i1:155-880(-)